MTPPLSARFGPWQLDEPRAGTLARARVQLANTGTVPWREDVKGSYHWLDPLGNPIVWDGLRTPLPHVVEPGAEVELAVGVRCPIPPGRYRFAVDLVAERRAWFGELGNEPAGGEVDVLPRVEAERLEVADVHVPDGVRPADGWADRVLAAHREGYAVVAGSIEAPRRLRRRLSAWTPGPGRVPAFPHPLLCPSVLRGVKLERLPDVEGLPAFAPPPDEPWVYDGRIVLDLTA